MLPCCSSNRGTRVVAPPTRVRARVSSIILRRRHPRAGQLVQLRMNNPGAHGDGNVSRTERVFPRIERRRSRVHGWGVFACEPIAKNKRIIDYAGEKISHKESVKRETRYLKRRHIWCFKLNNRWVIDGAVRGNLARFINHSCTPNCYAQIVDSTIWIRAARGIAPGEELTYNYNTDGDATIPCRCRPDCTAQL